jgi:CRP-like cAMP-binding protein
VAQELAAHCRRRMVANLVRTSEVLRAVRGSERKELVERFETRVYNKGDRIVAEGGDPEGLHLIASGEVAVVGHDKEEPIVLASLGPGDTVGEVALVLRRKANADVVATHPTVTLFLPRDQFAQLLADFPAILHGLYLLAVKRDDETASVLFEEAAEEVVDDYVLV